jgi:hypothetical protein
MAVLAAQHVMQSVDLVVGLVLTVVAMAQVAVAAAIPVGLVVILVA